MGNNVGLAWIDVSTGEFFSQQTSLESLRDDITRISPREVILDRTLEEETQNPILQALGEEAEITTTFADKVPPQPDAPSDSPVLESNDTESDPLDISAPLLYTQVESEAIALLTSVLSERLLENMPHLSSPIRHGTDSRMQIDAHTIHALEIKEEMREGGVKGSLLSSIRRTVTSGGTRLLTRWLCRLLLLHYLTHNVSICFRSKAPLLPRYQRSTLAKQSWPSCIHTHISEQIFAYSSNPTP